MYRWSLVLVKNSPLQSSIQSDTWIILSGFTDPSSEQRWNTTLIVDVLEDSNSTLNIIKTSTGSIYVLKDKPDISSFSNIPPHLTSSIKKHKSFPSDWKKILLKELNPKCTSSGRIIQKPRKYWISSEQSPHSFSSPKRKWGNLLSQ